MNRSAFRVYPYLQEPRCHEMTLRWVACSDRPALVECFDENSPGPACGQWSTARAASALDYGDWERVEFFAGHSPAPGFLHEAHLTSLAPACRYRYQVTQDGQLFSSFFHTAPPADAPIRFIAYADSESEPESAGSACLWDRPDHPSPRRYLVDQDQGYAANLAVIAARRPDFVLIAGDLVECGGEQRDWDHFWRHNQALAATTPLFTLPGNHDYYAGPHQGGYGGAPSERAVQKHLSYFRPADQPPGARYCRVDYGPVCLILLDVCRGFPVGSDSDTNHLLKEGSLAPDFNPGSAQYQWLVDQLEHARRRACFPFVGLHHCPYSSGIHGRPAGVDRQSGQPVRVLLPLLAEYGVTAVFSGHDEMFERSDFSGTQRLADGSTRPHTVQIYDVGVGGDDLRGPHPGVINPNCRFLAHRDAPEIWRDGVLVDGGKHYGHLEVEIQGDTATLTPVYVFPVVDAAGTIVRFERRVYDDIVTVRRI